MKLGCMSQELWSAVDRYLNELLVPSDPALDAALAASAEAGLPPINVAPNQGKLLQLLARLQGARAILEIGTLGGYSTIWLARGLAPGGRLITLEANPKHAEVAAVNIARAGLASVVELRLGQASETLAQLLAEGRGPFDLIFIDADKPGYPDYFRWALKLARRGSLMNRRQRGAQGGSGRFSQQRSPGPGGAQVQRSRSYGAASERHRDPDRGQQRL